MEAIQGATIQSFRSSPSRHLEPYRSINGDLFTFNLPAFLFHTLLDLMDSRYRRIREILPRKRFFNDLRALTCYLCFDSWNALMAFMIEKLELDVPDTG